MTRKCPISDYNIEIERLFHRILFILLIVFVCASAFCGCVSAADFSGGGGTPDDPYKISSPADLQNLSINVNAGNNYSGKYFQVTEEIDLGPVCNNTGGDHNWIPIGTYYNYFSGTFDGNGKTISNLYINDPTADYQGLFGYAKSANFTNVNLTKVNIAGNNSVGGLVGYYSINDNDNTHFINNCKVSGKVIGPNEESNTNGVGGLVGMNDLDDHSGSGNRTTILITNCCVDAEINGGDCVGGLVGINLLDVNNNITIINCCSKGDVICNIDGDVGGLIGSNDIYNATVKIENCYATGKVISTGDDSWTGGLIGSNSLVGEDEGSSSLLTITDCCAKGEVICSGNNESFAGGLIGNNMIMCEDEVECSLLLTIENCCAKGNVSGTDECIVGGLVGVNWMIWDYSNAAKTNLKITNCNATGNVRAGTKGYAGGLVGCDFFKNQGQLILGQLTIERCYATGNVIGNNSVGGLVGYHGNFDYNYEEEEDEDDYESSGGITIIKECYATGNVIGNNSVGGLVGYIYTNNGTTEITNSYATGKVNGFNNTTWGDYAGCGGLIGYLNVTNISKTTITDCHASGDVISIRVIDVGLKGIVGGLIGYVKDCDIITKNTITITDCYAKGDVISFDSHSTGGLIGSNFLGNTDLKVINCYADGNVTTNVIHNDQTSVGGLIGSNELDIGHITIINCNATGIIHGDKGSFGGLIGYNEVYGGIITIEKCRATGKVSSEKWYAVGGLIGVNYIGDDSDDSDDSDGGTLEITDSYAIGEVLGGAEESYAGGLIGWNEVTNSKSKSTITNCYSIGDVINTYTGDECECYTGGLVGYNVIESGITIIENTYTAGNVSGNKNVSGLIGTNIFEEGSGGKSYINNSSALNWYVNCSDSNSVGRIVGCNMGDGELSLNNNYAWEGMKNCSNFFTTNISLDDINGKNVSSVQVWANKTIYNNTLKWDFIANWIIIENDNDEKDYPLPYLTSLGKDDSLRAKVLYLKPVYVKFNENSGEGIMTDQPFSKGVPQNLSKNNFTRTGYTFAGWNKTSSSGTSIDYEDGKSISITENVTLYAIWTSAPNVNVTFDPNNGSPSKNQTISSGTETNLYTIITLGFTKDGFTFIGWNNTTSSGTSIDYADGASINITEDATLWAVWDKITPIPPTPIITPTVTPSGTSSSPYTTTYIGGINYEVVIGDNLTVFFNSTGGSHVDNQTNLHYGDKVIEPKNPTKDGYAFKAWYTANAYKWDFKNDTVNKSFTLYANWTAIPQKPGISWFWIILLIIAGVITAVIIKKIRDKKKEENYDVLS